MTSTSTSPSSSQTTPLQFFAEAQLLNGVDYTVRHVKQSSFTTQLSGRFYRNASISSHQRSAKRYEELQLKRKELAKHLELENEKVRYLEKKLREGQERRMEKEAQKERERNAVVKIQTAVRRDISRVRADVRRESGGRVALFVQTNFRRQRDHEKARGMRLRAIQLRNKEKVAVIHMQKRGRGMIARLARDRRLKLKEEERIRRRNSACLIQAFERGRVCRATTKRQMIELDAVVQLQRLTRGILGRRKAEVRKRTFKRRNKKRQQSSTKYSSRRIPIQERRYSTYTVDRRDSNVSTQRRSSDVSIQNEYNGSEHRSSMSSIVSSVSGLEIVRMAQAKGSNSGKANRLSETSLSAVDQSELDSVTSTIDSQTASILSARKRAAARSAKLQREARREKEKLGENAKAKKEDLNKLEFKRRNQMKEKDQIKKLNEKKKKIAMKTPSVIIDDKVDTKDTMITSMEKEREMENNAMGVSNIRQFEGKNIKETNQDISVGDILIPSSIPSHKPYETLLEDNFEDDFCENEDDLESALEGDSK